jgi:predicted PurR-regulated permease PerM
MLSMQKAMMAGDTYQNQIPTDNVTHEHNWHSIGRFTLMVAIYLCLGVFLSWLYIKVFMPIMASLFFAYMLNPWVDYFEQKRMNRAIVSALIIGGVILGISLGVIQVGPRMYDQLVDLIQKVPSLLDSVIKGATSHLREWVKESGIKDAQAVDRAIRSFNIMEQAVGKLQMAADGLWTTGANLMGSLVSIILTPFLTFYFLYEKPLIIQFFKKITPRDTRPYFVRMMTSLDETMKAVVRGHIKVALALATLYAIGFSSIGLSAGVAIGIAAGVCRVIPYLDAIVGSVLGVTYVFTSGMAASKIFAVLGVVGIVQVLDGALITPKLIGSRVGLHPAVVIVTVFAASYHFGFLGVLLAIPMAAIIKTLFNLTLPVFRDSRWFRQMP